MQTAPAVTATVDRVENAGALDRVSALVQRWVADVIPEGTPRELLTGRPLGHPAHPLLVQVPIGAWISGIAADVLGEPDAARKLIAAGCLAAVPAAAAGAADWLGTAGAQRRTGLVHAATNDVALTLFAMSWRTRRRGRRLRGSVLSLLGGGCVAVGGFLGGHLAYSQGVGVDTTEFEARHPG